MVVDILICTLNEGVYDVDKVLLPYHESIRYKVSHQISDLKLYPIPDELKRKDVEVCQICGVGLSFNRNNAISMAEGDVCVIADDDVRYCLNDIEKLIEIFSENQNLDVFVGKIRTYEGEPQYKNYRTRIRNISWLNIGSISSVEIAFRKESLINKNIFFDTNFGLKGSLYSKGEEAVFLSDCLRKNLKVVYFPVYIVKHHYYSSGKKSVYNREDAEYWGALSYRIFGALANVVMFILMIKQHSLFRHTISCAQYISSFRKGMKKIKS